MAFLLKREEGEAKALTYPVGTIHAVVVGVYNLGTHPNFFNKDKTIDDRRPKIALSYELCGHTYKDKQGVDHPVTILDGSEFNLWFNPKTGKSSAFYKKVQSILGAGNEGDLDEGIDPSILLRKNVWLTISEYKEGKFKITNHTEVPATVGLLAPTGNVEFFTLEPDAAGNIEVPTGIPQWTQDEITTSDEYVAWASAAANTVLVAAPLPAPVLANTPAPAVVPAAPLVAAPVVAVAPPVAVPVVVAPPVAVVAPVAVPVAVVAPVAVPAGPDLSKVPEALRATVEAGLAALNTPTNEAG